MHTAEQGKLYIIATPIGNLEDFTLRGLSVLKSVDLVLSEDTRETDKLLKRYEIAVSQIPYTDQKHSMLISDIMTRLSDGQNIALISDSGTPLISDPGFNLVRDLKNNGFEVTIVPGPNAAVSALAVSGLPTDKFIFLGFLPKGKNQIQTLLKEYGSMDASLVIYESPFRVKKLLREVNDVLGNRVVSLVKDLTKMFESVSTGYVEDILSHEKDIKEKGEYVVIIAKEGYKLNER